MISSGVIPPNPSELLNSDKMIELIDILKKKYDLILFDTPPIIAVTDALILSKYIDRLTNRKSILTHCHHLNKICNLF